VRSPGTHATRAGGVPHPDDAAAGPPPDGSGWLRGRGSAYCSPAPRAAVDGADVEPRLGPWDLGSWAGSRLEDLPAQDLRNWRDDPDWAGHGGESLRAVQDRVTSLLHDWHGLSGRRVASTHGSVVRAAVLIALRAPLAAAWDVDVQHSSATELHATTSGWRLVRLGCRP
jgi:broad specificity phosphatase PhoE